MAKYLVQTSHTKEECLADLEKFADRTPAMLDRLEWGCAAGDHTGYTFIEADREAAARSLLPEPIRDKAKLVEVGRFSVDQIRSFHK